MLCLVLLAMSFASVASAASLSARWGSPGSGDGQFHSPFAVAVHEDRVYVTDFDNDRVQAFTRDGKFLFAWGGSGSDPGQFHGPSGVAVDVAGTVLVADHYNHRIQKFTADGRFLAAWSAGDADAAPVGLAVDRENRVYATDLDAGRVRVWSLEGKLLTEWGSLALPWGIAVDPRGRVWVAEHGRDRLLEFTSAGQPLFDLDAAVPETRGPMAVAVAADGSLLVSDLRGGPLTRMTGIAVEPSGMVWAADPGRNQIARYSPEAQSRESVSSAPASFRLALSSMSRGSVDMRIGVPARGSVSTQVFSPTGRLVWSAPRLDAAPGEHTVTWNGRTSGGQPASTGVYFVRVRLDSETGRMERRGRIVLLR